MTLELPLFTSLHLSLGPWGSKKYSPDNPCRSGPRAMSRHTASRVGPACAMPLINYIDSVTRASRSNHRVKITAAFASIATLLHV